MVLGQEQIPQTELLGFGLQILDDLRVGVESGDRAGADLLTEDFIGGDTVLFDEAFDLWRWVLVLDIVIINREGGNGLSVVWDMVLRFGMTGMVKGRKRKDIGYAVV